MIELYLNIQTPVPDVSTVNLNNFTCNLLETRQLYNHAMHVKNWNRMQNAPDLGVFYKCEKYSLMLHIISLGALFSQNVKYWYEICDVLVSIFHVL